LGHGVGDVLKLESEKSRALIADMTFKSPHNYQNHYQFSLSKYSHDSMDEGLSLYSNRFD